MTNHGRSSISDEVVELDSSLYSTAIERASQRAAEWHRGQHRRASGVPYIQHPTSVALILARLGFGPHVLIAALLHDVVEDTAATLDQIAAEFGQLVADLVADLSERKLDEHGRTRPWIDRKSDHIEALRGGSAEVHAIALADKLQNLTSILVDLEAGRQVWSTFHASRDEVLWYHNEMIECCSGGEDLRPRRLADSCRRILARIVQLSLDDHLPEQDLASPDASRDS